MKRINLYITLVFALSLFACEDRLNLEPEQSLTPDIAIGSAANVQNILVGIYDEAAQTASYGGRLNLASELLANSGDVTWAGTFIEPDELNRKTVVTTNAFVTNYWLNAYEMNNQANIVIANLDKFEDDAERNRVEGEAKFLRALAYFDLVRLFALPFESGTANNQLGVPIVLEAVLDPEDVTEPARNSVAEVYAQILNDLQSAATLLPESNGEFADRYAALALLARVYLQQDNYAAARDAAHDVLSNSGHFLTTTFAAAFNNDGDASEDIFAWQITSQDGINDMNTFWATQAFGGRGDVAINASFFTIYDDAANDERASFVYGATYTNKWQSQFANIPFLRIAEMHLIRAECNLREGTALGFSPLEEINALRARSGAGALGALTLQDILDERKRELAFEGFAIHDIKRIQGNVGALNYDDGTLVLPIPQRERDANPNLEQNPGYAN